MTNETAPVPHPVYCRHGRIVGWRYNVPDRGPDLELYACPECLAFMREVTFDQLTYALSHCDDCGCEYETPRSECECECHGEA